MANYNYGVITAIITPFKNGKVDHLSLEKLVKHQLQQKIEGFVINGTTGESPTLKWEEVSEIYGQIKSLVPENFPLIIGTGSNSTEKTIEATKAADKLGAKSVLVVVPYYNKPPQRGLVSHFNEVAKNFSGDVIVYNVPGRTITSLTAASLGELAKGNIVAVKEASGNIDFDKEVRGATPAGFQLLSGDDGTFDQFMKVGGSGIISVASHIIPKAFIDTKNTKGASGDIQKYKELIDALYIEANPIPVKAALKLMGIIESAELRLPLVELDKALYPKLELAMKNAGIL